MPKRRLGGGVGVCRYIEDIGKHHPKLMTDALEACAVASCRKSGASPWALDTDCRRLPRNGTATIGVSLSWRLATDQLADQAERTYQAHRVTEDGAVGTGAAVFAALDEGDKTAERGTQGAVDALYWYHNAWLHALNAGAAAQRAERAVPIH